MVDSDKRYGEFHRQVESKVEVFSLNALNLVDHTFSASVYVQLRVPKSEMTVEGMEKINCEFLNLKSTDKDNRNVDMTDTHICKHIVVAGDWVSALSLGDFPMDQQVLEVKFELWDEGDMSSPLIPVGYNESIAKGFMLTDSFKLMPKIREKVVVLDDIPTFHMQMTLKRRIGFYVCNYVLPIAAMTSLSFTALGIEITETGDRLATVLSLLLTVVAYKMALADNLPDVSTPCKLDYFMAGSFFCMGAVTIVLSLVKVLGETVDTIIICMMPIWILFLAFVAYTGISYGKTLDDPVINEDYQPMNAS